MTAASGLRWRYYAFKATTAMGLYLPVYVVYVLDQGYGLGFVALTQATFSAVMLAAELPTGYLGDRIGRRWTLVLGNALRAAGVAGYAFVDTAAGFLFLKVLTGTAWAFRSGTLDAWLYELLAAYDDTDAFALVSSRGRTAVLATSAAGAIAGGLLYGVDPRLPFLANGALAALSVALLFTFPSAAGTGTDAGDDGAAPDDGHLTVREALATLRLQVGRPAVRWMVAYSVLLFLVFDLSRTFEQPALDAVGVSVAGMGLLYAAFKLVSAAAASVTGWLVERLGVRRTLALGAPALGLAYASVLVLPAAVVPVLFVYRSSRAVLKPVRNQYLNDRLADVGRATVLSGASMVLSLAGVVGRLVGGVVAPAVGPVAFLGVAGVGLTLAAGGLWVAVDPVRPASGPAGAGGSPADD